MSGIVLDLGPRPQPDVAELVNELAARWPGGLAVLRAEVQQLQRAGRWPHPVPPSLMAGLGPAQFVAALRELGERLGLAPETPVPPAASRPLSADERRLLADVPPHHG